MTNFDLSVYLVTNAEMVPAGGSFIEYVRQAIENGVTCLQLREKDLNTRDFIARAREVKKLTDKAGIPLIINDRADIALAVDAHLHVGQDDMTVQDARKLLGPDKIIGVSASKPHEILKALEDGADYVGIGICFDTKTKVTAKLPMGPIGAQKLLQIIKDSGKPLKTCLIGGINETNVQRVRAQARIPGLAIDGVAIVSCIMASPDPATATRKLVSLWNETPIFWQSLSTGPEATVKELIRQVRTVKPLVHHITNGVVKNFSANVTLAIGAAPLMSECPEEFGELAQYPNNSLVLNTGTPTEEETQMYLQALKAYNKHGKPVVYDPVGAGASTIRRLSVQKLLLEGYMTVIKGNQGEIFTAAGIQKSMRGVDSGSEEALESAVSVAKTLAVQTRSVVVVTGKKDIVVDGVLDGRPSVDGEVTVAIIEGGHELMGNVTGTGCSLGSTIAAFVAANKGSPFLATVAACSVYKQAGRKAGARAAGPGSFQTLFLDQLQACTETGDYENFQIIS
ncbi:hypothetical protein OGAPHI_004371 [Ogataea philodendri]|uniref:Thiamine phosphate synthase/TenI domain-containing protein n=1 Tax=Ogataea philodendri TaxID=1378263 RepID=A0A9P8P6J3_9ASCO|nr:uncharacterized protein OGAPHI_004371 [Ogataea philodendri]KAH3666182.1 hypothetical protein OGAPHI_004371 [Ogataea philodendri]